MMKSGGYVLDDWPLCKGGVVSSGETIFAVVPANAGTYTA
jgi:hypothetical protein